MTKNFIKSIISILPINNSNKSLIFNKFFNYIKDIILSIILVIFTYVVYSLQFAHYLDVGGCKKIIPFLDYLLVTAKLWFLPFIWLCCVIGISWLMFSVSLFYSYYAYNFSSLQECWNIIVRHFYNQFSKWFIWIQIFFWFLLNNIQNSNLPFNIVHENWDWNLLFCYSSGQTFILQILLGLFFICYIYMLWSLSKNSNKNFITIVNLYILIFFLIILLIYCSHLVLLIILLEILLLTLLFLLKVTQFEIKISFNTQSILIFIIAQAIATAIYCYGLSILYSHNFSLTYSSIFNFFNITTLSSYENILFGGFYIFFALLIKMGVGPLAFWIFYIAPVFNYYIFALYFSVIKPVYLCLIVLLLSTIFGPIYQLQGLTTLPLNNSLLLHFSSIFKQTNLTILTEILQPLKQFSFNFTNYIFMFSILTLIIGVFGLFFSDHIKKLLAYSSFINYSLILYLITVGTKESLHVSLSYIIIYSLLNIVLIWIINITNNEEVSLNNFPILNKDKPLFTLIILMILVSLAGIPPFVGFATKFSVFMLLYKYCGLLYSGIFIFFSLIAIFGYFRLIKLIYGVTTIKSFFIFFEAQYSDKTIFLFDKSLTYTTRHFINIFVYIIFSIILMLNLSLNFYIYNEFFTTTYTIFNQFAYIYDFSLTPLYMFDQSNIIIEPMLQYMLNFNDIEFEEFLQLSDQHFTETLKNFYIEQNSYLKFEQYKILYKEALTTEQKQQIIAEISANWKYKTFRQFEGDGYEYIQTIKHFKNKL